MVPDAEGVMVKEGLTVGRAHIKRAPTEDGLRTRSMGGGYGQNGQRIVDEDGF